MDLQDYPSALPLAKKAYDLNPSDEWCKCYFSIIKDMMKNKNLPNLRVIK
jgi:hypothetical protein